MDLRRKFASDLAQTKMVLADASSALFTRCPRTDPEPAAPPACDIEDDDSVSKYPVKEAGRYYQGRLRSGDCMARPSVRTPLTPPCTAPRTCPAQTPSPACAPPPMCPAAPACPAPSCPAAPACPAPACPPAPPLPVPAARPSLCAPPAYPAAQCPTVATAAKDAAPAESPVLESRVPDKVLDAAPTSSADAAAIKKELENIAQGVRDLSTESVTLTRDIEQAKRTTNSAIQDLRRLLTSAPGASGGDTPSAVVDRVDNAGAS